MSEVTGNVRVWFERARNGDRLLHLSIDSLPGWAMGMLADAAPFRLEAASYGPGSSPTSVLLTGARVFVHAEPAPPPQPDVAPDRAESDGPY